MSSVWSTSSKVLFRSNTEVLWFVRVHTVRSVTKSSLLLSPSLLVFSVKEPFLCSRKSGTDKVLCSSGPGSSLPFLGTHKYLLEIRVTLVYNHLPPIFPL